MSTEALTVERREVTGGRGCARLRQENKIPAVLYGRKQDVLHLTVTEDQLRHVLRHDAQIVELQVDGGKETVLIKEVQYDFLGDRVLHVDFARISLTEEIEVTVTLTPRGDCAGAAKGGVLSQLLRELRVKCLPTNIPAAIPVDVSKLEIDQLLRISDLTLPEGVRSAESSDVVVFQVSPPREEEEAVAPTEEAPTEPELIKREREAAEGEEEGEAES
jgi:large subunit ribosomal protein L25